MKRETLRRTRKQDIIRIGKRVRVYLPVRE